MPIDEVSYSATVTLDSSLDGSEEYNEMAVTNDDYICIGILDDDGDDVTLPHHAVFSNECPSKPILRCLSLPHLSPQVAGVSVPLPSLSRSDSHSFGTSNANDALVSKTIRHFIGWRQGDKGAVHEKENFRIELAPSMSELPFPSSSADDEKEGEERAFFVLQMTRSVSAPALTTIDGMEGSTFDDDETTTDDNVCSICLCSYG